MAPDRECSSDPRHPRLVPIRCGTGLCAGVRGPDVLEQLEDRVDAVVGADGWRSSARLAVHELLLQTQDRPRGGFVDLESATTDRMGAYLRQFIDEDDFLFVVQFQGRPYKQRCYRGTEAWLDERFPAAPGPQRPDG